MRTTMFLLGAVVLCAWAGSAAADWDPQNPDPRTKWVQLPDPNGWDVKATWPKVLADDFLCTETGLITDVHLWGSWKDDCVGEITNIRLSFHSDIPANGACDYSRPGDLLWYTDIDPRQAGDAVSIRQVACGDEQGWYVPGREYADKDNHDETWQVNVFLDRILPVDSLFYQEAGNVYWLDVQVGVAPVGDVQTSDWGGDRIQQPYFGWKTSIDHWNDDAVWGLLYDGEDGESWVDWQELRDPCTGESLDLAFVITGGSDTLVPEPGVLTVAGFGLVGLLARRRRK